MSCPPRSLAAILAASTILTACASGAGPGDGAGTTAATAPDPITEPTTADPEPPGSATEPDGLTLTLTVSDGQVSGTAGRVKVALGEDLTLRVTADTDDEIHVHGYDIHEDVATGEEATLTFAADIPGIFEVELEGAGLTLVELEVS